MVSGGNSLSRYFVTGQLNPQPTEVMARNIRPAGAIRARAAIGFDSVMELGNPGWNSAVTLPLLARPRPSARRACQPGPSVAYLSLRKMQARSAQ